MAKDNGGHGSEKRAEHGKYGNGTEYHGEYRLTAQHPTGQGPKFSAKAASEKELHEKVNSMRKSKSDYHVTISSPSGEVRTLRKYEKL